jgi:GNAT superfamily N-acetyltransferase
MSKNLIDLESDITIKSQYIHIRPISSKDIEKEKKFVAELSPESRHFRFLSSIRNLTEKEAYDLCDIDYDNKMAFIAVIKDSDNIEQEIGVSRYATDNNNECECAVTVAEEWKNHGLGKILMDKLIDFARSKGKKVIYSIDLADNTNMNHLAKNLGMTSKHDPEDATMVRYELKL